MVPEASLVHQFSPADTKIRLFRSLFRGRDDIYPRRFESRKTGRSGYAPACANEWVRGICEKPRIKCSECQFRQFLPITDDVIRWHLSGFDPAGESFVAGVYPMLQDETCFFLAVDFDKDGWQEAAGASLPASAVPGWPADVLLPSEPEWKRDYAATVRRLIRDGVDTPLANLFVRAIKPSSAEETGVARARSASEAFLYRRLETLAETKGQFQLNTCLPIAFDGQSEMEVDFVSLRPRLVVELDGEQHLSDAQAYRRDRRKDCLLQQNGYLVLRFLGEDLSKDLDGVLNSILQALAGRQRSVSTS